MACARFAFNVCVLHNEVQVGECLQRQTLTISLCTRGAHVLLRVFKNVNSLTPTFNIAFEEISLVCELRDLLERSMPTYKQ